jgi:NAD(P)-dependent dehydrogenase (short-subunit alcohol dehydrogenase family)
VKKLQGRVALVTGGGRGIGAAIALAFASEGASLMIASRTPSELDGVTSRCRSLGVDCSPSVTDVSSRTDVQQLVRATLDTYGRIDVLVNAAGVYGPIGTVAEVDVDDWERAIRVNLMGTVYACHYTVPAMAARKSGSIINFSGGGATAPLPRFSAYGVSKAAVVRLSETLAEEVIADGIRVNAIAPGAIDTTLQDEVIKAGQRAGPLYKRIVALRESGAGGTPVEVPANLAVFLASDDSVGLTGRLISAPHDPWREWDSARIASLAASPWYTLRRLDPFTIGPLKDQTP